METHGNRDGKMTAQRADAIKAFVRQRESSSDDAVSKSVVGLKRIVSDDKAKVLGMELIEEIQKDRIDLKRVEELILGGADTNLKHDGDMTPLMWASYLGRDEAVEALTSGCADLDFSNKWGHTALMYTSNSRRGQVRQNTAGSWRQSELQEL